MQLTLAGVGLTSLGYILGRGVTRFFSSSAKKKSKAYPPTQLWDPKFLSNIDAFIFDCDGVLWRGAYPIKGAAATLNKLKAMNKKVMFVTNNSTKSRAQYVSKLATYNLIAEEQDVFSASYAAASFLDAMPEFDKKNKKVYAIGGEGIKVRRSLCVFKLEMVVEVMFAIIE